MLKLSFALRFFGKYTYVRAHLILKLVAYLFSNNSIPGRDNLRSKMSMILS